MDVGKVKTGDVAIHTFPNGRRHEVKVLKTDGDRCLVSYNELSMENGYNYHKKWVKTKELIEKVPLNEKKVIFSDLDGTLIETLSGQTFQQGAWDVKLKLDVWAKIKELFSYEGTKVLGIVTNQGGIETGRVKEGSWVKKAGWVTESMKEYLGPDWIVICEYCSSHDDHHPERKPNIGMLQNILSYLQNHHGYREWNSMDKGDCIMIGDASGKLGDWSDSDLRTANNFGCEYVDVRDLLKM